VPELTGSEPAARCDVLQGRQLGLMLAGLARPRGALILTGELDSAEQLAQTFAMRLWLWTHWPTSLRMRPVSRRSVQPPEEQFAANLRRLRRAADLSQEQLAGRTGLHPTEISRLERAAREPRLGTIVRLARGLDVPVERLVSGIR